MSSLIFQTNFYLDDSSETPEPSRNPKCDLCDEGHEASFACSACPSKFCSDCRSVHDVICKDPVVYEISENPTSQGDLPTKVKVVTAKVERLEKLTEMTPVLSRDLNATQEKSVKLSDDLAALQTRHTATVTTLEGLQNSTEARLQDLCERLSLLGESHKKLNEAHKQLASNHQESYSSLQRTTHLQRKDMDTLIKEVQRHWAKFADCEGEIEDLHKRNFDLEERFSAFDQHLSDRHSDLDRRYSDLDRRYSDLGKRHSDLNQRHSDLDQRYSDLNQRHLDLEERHSDLDICHSDLENLHDNLGKSHTELQECQSSLEARHLTLKDDFAELQLQHRSLSNDHQDLSMRCSNLQQKLDENAKFNNYWFGGLVACLVVIVAVLCFSGFR